MRRDIIKFFKPFVERYKLGLYYIPSSVPNRDCYVVHKNGKIILNVSTEQFYQLPKPHRFRDTLARLKLGLAGALKEKDMKHPAKWGKKIF